MRAYFRMISGVDRVVGRIHAELERLGYDENTVIIYMSDNGYYMGERGFAGKWTHYEESLRVPLIIRDPRVETALQSRVSDSMVLNIDVPRTLLDIADVPVPQHYQGRSLVSHINGEEPELWRQEFFCEHMMEYNNLPRWEGVRGERFVYARYLDQDPVYEFLHDLETDPDQLKNLAKNPEYTEALGRMRERTEAYVENFTAVERESYGAQ